MAISDSWNRVSEETLAAAPSLCGRRGWNSPIQPRPSPPPEAKTNSPGEVQLASWPLIFSCRQIALDAAHAYTSY